jgi:hypothetical protein
MCTNASPGLTSGRKVLAMTQPVSVALTRVGFDPKASEIDATKSPFST